MLLRNVIDRIVIAGALFCVISIASPAIGQQVSLERVLEVYLKQDCGTGERDPLEWFNRVVSFGDSALPLLLRAVSEGPPTAEQDSFKVIARVDFSRFREFLQNDGLSALQNEDVKRDAAKLDERAYVEMRVRSFVRGYQERALNALQSLKNPSIIDSLRSMADQEELPDDLKRLIRKVIDSLQQKQ